MPPAAASRRASRSASPAPSSRRGLRPALLAACAAVACAAGRPAPPREPADLAAFAQAALKHAWDGYRKYAWGHDELRPVSRTARDWYRETLLIIAVDARVDLIVGGLSGEAGEARASGVA